MSAYVSKYSWKPGYSYKVSATTVGKALESIEQREGTVTAKSFLEYSRSEDAETHSMFEWDDSKAAEKYRLSQSGNIINQLAVEIVYAENTEPTELSVNLEGEVQRKQVVSAYLNIAPKSTKASASFVNLFDALGDDERKKQVLANAKGELTAFKRKYGTFRELAAIIFEIDKFIGVEEECAESS